MISPIEFIWPYIRKETKQEAVEDALYRHRDLDAIKNSDWSKDSEVALDQARLLAEQETDRKRSAENKASIYLAVIAAIVPVLSSLLTDFFAADFRELPISFQVISIGLFVLGMLYLAMSGVWAFRTLAVSTHARIDATDLANVWAEQKPTAGLARELLLATRLNRNGVNKKMDYIRLAHEFLLRTFLSFALLLLVIVLREPFQALLGVIEPWIKRLSSL
ncbi:MAG: hypothetical protein QHC90_05140 [Shinella sp.]|nr:hypothetical protein [Shinella sp.]